jgi:hypothetical protein
MNTFITPNGLHIVLPENGSEHHVKLIREGLRITQVGSPRSTVFTHCIVLKYADELLIYQKRLFSKKCSLRFRIMLLDEQQTPAAQIKNSIRLGYLTFSVEQSNIQMTEIPEGYSYVIPLPNDSFLTQGQYLSFTLDEVIV